MDAPQSQDEVGPVVDALRRIDPLLDVIWNPKARMVERGAYSVLGKATAPKYVGRWQVIRYDTPHTDSRRNYCLICTITRPEVRDGITCLVDNGEYMPVGSWLVDFMQSADAANTRACEALRARLWAQDDALDSANDTADAAMATDALDRVHFDANYAGGVGNWMGRGAAFSPPLTSLSS